MYAFFLSLSMIFMAELGDKTQLVALCLASRFNVRTVLSGIFVATLLVHVVSVVLGALLGNAIPDNWIKLCAGIAFIGFGLWTLRGDELSDDECKNIKGRSPFLLVATTFFLAELGDKTMISTVTLATDYSMIPVWIGSTLGMVLSDGFAIIVGLILGAKLPERAVKIGAAFIFFGFGIWKLIEGGTKLPIYAWGIAGAVITALVILFLLLARRESRLSSTIKPADDSVEVG